MEIGDMFRILSNSVRVPRFPFKYIESALKKSTLIEKGEVGGTFPPKKEKKEESV